MNIKPLSWLCAALIAQNGPTSYLKRSINQGTTNQRNLKNPKDNYSEKSPLSTPISGTCVYQSERLPLPSSSNAKDFISKYPSNNPVGMPSLTPTEDPSLTPTSGLSTQLSVYQPWRFPHPPSSNANDFISKYPLVGPLYFPTEPLSSIPMQNPTMDPRSDSNNFISNYPLVEPLYFQITPPSVEPALSKNSGNNQ